MGASGRVRERGRMGVILAALALAAGAGAQYHERPEVADYILGLGSEHGFDHYWLTGVFATARKNAKVLERISRPAEKALAWHEYRRIFLTDKRIDGGVAFWRQHAELLDSAAQRFGVRPAIIVAILGVETFYGRIKGDYPVLDALATLAFDYPRRAKFFKGELTEFLLLAREEGGDPAAYTGSYAGAMGYGQFIPSSYRAFAVDFDGDGQRDIWDSIPDAVGSVANYFARHGWRGEQPVAITVRLAAPAAEGLVSTGLTLGHTVAALRAGGVAGAEQLPGDAAAALYRMEAETGAEHWLALHDFYVITRYNRSAMYALAVHQLAEAVAARRSGTGGVSE